MKGNKENILYKLNKLLGQERSWLWSLNKIRNHGTHTRLINIRVHRGIGGAEVDDRITFRIQSDYSLPVIPYLEECMKYEGADRRHAKPRSSIEIDNWIIFPN